MISPCIFHQYHYPIMVLFPWYSHDYPHYQKSDVNGLFSNISWITSHLTSYSHTNFPLHQQKYYNGEAPNDSEVDTPNFISYMVIICFLFGYYGLCDVFFSHGITIVFPILFTGFAPTNIGWPEGSASEIFKGGTGRPWLIPSSKLKRLVVGLKYFERCVMTFHINWE